MHPTHTTQSGAILLLISVALSLGGLFASTASVAASPCSPPSACTSGGGTTTGGIQVQQTGSLKYNASTITSSTPPPPNSGSPGTSSCSGTGYEYYNITITSLTTTYRSGVNGLTGTGIGFTGGSPYGTYDYNNAKYGNLLPATISPTQNYYVAWEGTWTPVMGQVTTANYAWVNTDTTTTTYTTATSSVEDVYDTTVSAPGQPSVVVWWIYKYEYVGTTTSTVVVGCNLQDFNVTFA